MTADIGTLTHIERAMNPSGAREMAFTGGDYTAQQMLQWGSAREEKLEFLSDLL